GKNIRILARPSRRRAFHGSIDENRPVTQVCAFVSPFWGIMCNRDVPPTTSVRSVRPVWASSDSNSGVQLPQERWTKQFHPMRLVPLWIVKLGARFAGLFEVALDLCRGRKGDNHAAGLFTNVSPDVRHVARPQHRVPRLQAQLLLADLHHHFATFDQIEPLVLLEVHVARRAPASHVPVFHYEHCAVCLTGENLEIEMAASAYRFVRLSCAVSACLDNLNGLCSVFCTRKPRSERKSGHCP